MKFEKTDIYSAIDPYFQNLLQRRQRGLIKPFTASTGTGEIAVVARVDNPDSWENISEVRTASVIQSSPNSEYIVTGRIPVQRIEAVRAADGVYSLKPARKLRRMLDETVVDTRSRADLLPDNSSIQQGAGVVVGIVDFGCDFVHQNFRHADGSTRLLGIWDQNGASNASSPFGYGRFYDRNAINLALQSSGSLLYSRLRASSRYTASVTRYARHTRYGYCGRERSRFKHARCRSCCGYTVC